MSKTANGATTFKEETLSMMRIIAQADSQDEFEEKVNILRSSPTWQENSEFRGWFSGTWLKECKVGSTMIVLVCSMIENGGILNLL